MESYGIGRFWIGNYWGVGKLILDLRFQVTRYSPIYTKSLLEGEVEKGRKGEGKKTETSGD